MPPPLWADTDDMQAIEIELDPIKVRGAGISALEVQRVLQLYPEARHGEWAVRAEGLSKRYGERVLFEELTLDLAAHRAWRSGTPLALTAR